MTQLRAVVTIALVLAAAAPAAAQQAARDSARKPVAIPADARPPKGMCRIWLDGVPAVQQPAPTDCKTAVRNVPATGRVLFGDDFADSSKRKPDDKGKLPPGAKGFTSVKPPDSATRPPES